MINWNYRFVQDGSWVAKIKEVYYDSEGEILFISSHIPKVGIIDRVKAAARGYIYMEELL